MARANRHYIPGCAAIGREVMGADGVYVAADNERRTVIKGRREFMQGSLVFAGAAVVGSAMRVQAESKFPAALRAKTSPTLEWGDSVRPSFCA